MSSLTPEQQQPIDDMIRCGFMDIGQGLHEAKVGVDELVKRLVQERDA